MIYVDETHYYPRCKLPTKYWSHMATDTSLEELHAMAHRMGLPARWFHNVKSHPHYDITPLQREQALQLGARSVTSRELIKRCWPSHAFQGKVTHLPVDDVA